MLNLPASTKFNRRIPKKKFYENLSVPPELRRIFIDQIQNIIWANKLAQETVNIAPGERVTEIEVFEVKLNVKHLDEKVLKLIDQGIPYHIVFILHYENEIQLWTAYKEIKANGFFRVESYYHTQWMDESAFSWRITGLTLEQAYENLVREIAGDELTTRKEESLQESVERTKEIKKLKAKVDTLQAKVKKEKQFNKRVKLNAELKKLKIELQNRINGKNEDGIS